MNTTPSGDESGERVDAGLRAAFDPSDSFAFPPPSALEALSRSASTSLPRVLLRSPTEAEPESVVRPSSEELPSGPTGRYQLHGEIARGGMGVVVRGRDVDLGRDLALKVLLGRHQRRPEMIERFVEEAQIGGQLQHPGIVPVYELGHFPGGRPYFTMKLVKGKTLAALLAARKDPGEDRARFLGIFEQVAQTLAYAHARGVIHRDLKPSNVMVGSFGEVQVMDWGLAKVLRDGGVADERKAGAERASVSEIRTARSEGSSGGSSGYETEAGSVLGTPAYMAPEQARGEVETLDERADVFGLGAILCEILTNDPPFTGKPAEAQRKARQGDLREARERLERCGADPEVVEIAARCLGRVPQDRLANAGEVAAAVSGYLQSVEKRLRKAELERAEERARAEEAQARMREEERGRKEAQARALAEGRARRLTVALAALVLVVVTGGGTAGIWLKAERDQKQAQAVRQVHLALERAEGLRERAKAAAPGHFGPWQAAGAEADRAREIAESGGVGAEILTRVNDLIRGIGEEERSQKLLADIEAAWLAQMDFVIERNRWSREQAVPILREAFEAYGLPAGKGDAKEAAAKVRSLPAPVRDALIAALDDWIYIAGNRDYRVDEPHLEWLRAVVAEADTDPWRQALRAAAAESDQEERKRAIEELAEAADLERQPLPDVMLLVRQLESSAPEKAIQVLTKAAAAHPDDFSVLFRLGMALNFHTKSPRPEEAVRYLTAAVTLRPQSAKAQLNLGNALRDQGKIGEAMAAYQRAIQLQPKYSAGYNNLGNAMDQLGKFDEAIGYYRKAIELDPDSAMAYANLASVLGKLGKTEEATALLKKSLEVDPKYAAAYNNLGAAMQEQGKIDEAIAHYRKAIELSPDNQFAYNNLGNALGDKGELEEAISLYQKAIELKPNYAEAHFNLGMLLSKHDRIDEAVAAYKKAIELKPDFAKAYRALGAILTNHDRAEEALPLYQKALELEPDFADAYYDLGLTQTKRGRLEEAITAFKKTIELKPQDAEAQLQLGEVLTKQGKTEEAIATYQKAIEIKPNYADPYNGLGVALERQGKIDEAILALKKAVELRPDYALAYQNLGLDLSKRDRFEEAIAAFQKAVELEPDAETLFRLGYALSKQGRFEEAIAANKKSIELEPENANSYLNLGCALSEAGKVGESIAQFRKALELDQKNAQAYQNLGVALNKLGKFEEAIPQFKKAIELKQDYSEAHNDLGGALRKLNKLDEAVAVYRKAVELMPENGMLACNLGHTLKQKGKSAEALKWLERSHELEPNHPEIPKWIEETRSLLAAEAKLPALLQGGPAPGEASGFFDLAWVAYHQQLFLASARFYAEGLSKSSAGDSDSGEHRYNGACAAALAASDRGADGEKLDEAGRARWRRQAREWLRAELKLSGAEFATAKPETQDGIRQILAQMLSDSDFAGVRGEKALAKLPAPEAKEWRRLWKDVAGLLERARAE